MMTFRNIAGSWAPALLFLLTTVFSVQGQQLSGVYTATGAGTGATREEALEAARLDAVNTLVFSVIKRDSVYRDLFVPEAFKNGWVHALHAEEGEKGRWSADAEVRVDESLVEALYVGRYSTTVVNLLDAAESALAETEILMAEGGRSESNADLGGAETAYRRAEAKTDEIMRYLGPIEDAVYFSSLGKRKALELKALVNSYRSSAQEGVARIRSGQQRLAVDRQAAQVLEILEQVEGELPAVETVADALHPVASAPRSYTTEYLEGSRADGRRARESLSHRRSLIQEALAGLPADLQYPRTRASLLMDRLDELERRLRSADSALSAELTMRSTPVKTALWILNHEPTDQAAVSFMFPWSVSPGDGGTSSLNLPVYFEGRAEGAFGLGDGGFWCRTGLLAGRETIFDTSDMVVRQSVEAGFFGGKLLGVGIAWDWLRYDADETKRDGVVALSLIMGRYGARDASLSGVVRAPLWITAFSWEMPRGDDSAAGDILNLGLSSMMRPSRSIRLEANVAGRMREAADRWEGTAGAGFAFRLPVLRPLLWRIRWEGAMNAPVADREILFEDAESIGAFRFGLEYTF